MRKKEKREEGLAGGKSSIYTYLDGPCTKVGSILVEGARAVGGAVHELRNYFCGGEEQEEEEEEEVLEAVARAGRGLRLLCHEWVTGSLLRTEGGCSRPILPVEGEIGCSSTMFRSGRRETSTISPSLPNMCCPGQPPSCEPCNPL